MGVLVRRLALDEVIADVERGRRPTLAGSRDRAFARMMAATVLRRLGQIDDILSKFLDRPLPADQAEVRAILQLAAAQLLFLGTPAHAAINIAVEQVRRSETGARLDGLVNAILRRVSEQGPALLAKHDEGGHAARLNMPEWLLSRWIRSYGEERALAIADASLREAALDLTVRSDPAEWAEKLGGIVLPTGTVRLEGGGRIEDLAGFAEGEWWVQDAAAALPARLLGEVAGKTVADLCAAPGGKTLELAAAGARVTAVDWSLDRLGRLKQNLARVRLTAETVEADAANWMPSEQFDAVLLDAPCTATGTVRRHPDIIRLKREADVAKLADVQTRLLRNAVQLVKPGGLVVYCVCSLEPEEGPELIGRFLAGTQMVELVPVVPDDVSGLADLVSPRGHLRTFPDQMRVEPPGISGMDGFFAARLRRIH